jgi:hypothetical protein
LTITKKLLSEVPRNDKESDKSYCMRLMDKLLDKKVTSLGDIRAVMKLAGFSPSTISSAKKELLQKFHKNLKVMELIANGQQQKYVRKEN